MNNSILTGTEQEKGDNIWFAGGLVTFKVTSEQSRDALVMTEHAARRGKTTPLHLHESHDETVYVLEGEFLLHIDGVEKYAGPGDCIYIPRGKPHAFLVTSETERSLWIVTPGGAMEKFYRQAGEVASSQTLPATQIDFARIRTVGEETGAMKFLGPPPFPPSAIG